MWKSNYTLIILITAFFILGISLYVFLYKHRPVKSFQPTGPVAVVMADGGEEENTHNGSGDIVETVDAKERNVASVSYYDISVCEGREECPTANGEQFDQMGLTFAHKSMEFGTRVQFCLHGRCVTCRGNDRGPYIPGREFDLSYGCAEAIGMVSQGVAEVEWEIVK